MARRKTLRILWTGIIAAIAAMSFVVAPAHDGAGLLGLQKNGETVIAAVAPAERQAVAVPQRETAKQDVLSLDAVNMASLAAATGERERVNPAFLKAQILLDRAGYSPGAIDGRLNGNFRAALAAFQEENGLDQTAFLDEATWRALVATSADPVLMEYAITQADTKGPFAPDIPEDMENWSTLRRLSYRDPGELLAEKFHLDRRLLSALNPGASFDEPGARILVARVGRPDLKATVTRIAVDKQRRSLRAYDKDGRLVGVYPASIGSAEKPTPNGAFVVRRVARYPEWRYNPRFAFKEIKTNRAFRVAAGPNNPLGTVWIGISKPSYGIHGTPSPEEVGTSASHGCVRLTNWDVQTLASMVRRGTKVEFVE